MDCGDPPAQAPFLGQPHSGDMTASLSLSQARAEPLNALARLFQNRL